MANGTSLTVPAPAKLNLFLHVTGRRADGYHMLESLMVLLDFGDVVTLTACDDGTIGRVNAVPGVEAGDDLAVRAARLLQARCGVRQGVSIALDKRIPIGAGMGGGSSDAASVLLALNRLWNLGMARDELMELGLQLGADVPFFIFGANAHATGIGETLREVSVPRLKFIILSPPVLSATRDVFSAGPLKRDTPLSNASAFAPAFGINDLQSVAVARHPAIEASLKALDTVEFAGAERRAWTSARMTGSGSAVFRIVDPPLPVSPEGWRAAGMAERDAWKFLQRIHYLWPKSHDGEGWLAAGSKLIRACSIARHPLRDFVIK